MPAATVLHQEIEQRAHAAILGGVYDIPAFAPLRDQPGMFEFFQMEGEGGRRDPERCSDRAGRFAFGPRFHKPPKNREPRLLGKRGQGGEGFIRFHISRIMKL